MNNVLLELSATPVAETRSATRRRDVETELHAASPLHAVHRVRDRAVVHEVVKELAGLERADPRVYPLAHMQSKPLGVGEADRRRPGEHECRPRTGDRDVEKT